MTAAADTPPAPPDNSGAFAAEETALGWLLSGDGYRWLELTIDHFHNRRHRVIFAEVAALHAKEQPHDVATTVASLAHHGKLEAVGDAAVVERLADDTIATEESISAYVEKLKSVAADAQPEDQPPPDDGAPPFDYSEELRANGHAAEATVPAAQPPGVMELLEQARTTSFTSLNDVRTSSTVPKVPLIPDLLYPGAWLLVGRPKIGKSWLLLQLTLAFAEGTSFLGYPCDTTEAEVLCIFAEDDDARIQSRLSALGVARAPASCHVVNQAALRSLAARFAEQLTFVRFLEVWLSSHPKVRLVLIDTETTVRQLWVGGAPAERFSRVVETDYQQTRAFDELGLQRQLAVVLVNHASKLRNGEWHDIHELINRSNTALAGASGSIALADPPDVDRFNPKQKTRVLGIRGRDLREDVLLAIHQREDMPYFVSDGPYAEVRQTQVESQLMEALEELQVEAGPEEYIGTDDLAAAVCKTRGTVKRAMSRMLSKGRGRWKKSRITVKRGKGGGYRLDPIGDTGA